MRKFGRLMSILVLMALLIPAYAQATGQFVFEAPSPPGHIFVGQNFNVNVYLAVGNSPVGDVRSYQYCVNYDQSLIRMVPLDIDCTTTPTDTACDPPPELCIAVPPVDGGFFNNVFPYPGYRDCSDNCTDPYFPQAKNCSSDTVPICNPANVFFADEAGRTGSEETGFTCPCAHATPFGRTLVSTYKFQALKAGCFRFAQNDLCTSQIVDCQSETTTDTMKIENTPDLICITSNPSVPALSGYGMILFALVIAGSFILIMRRHRGTKRSAS
jgi:hypothetical protein